MLLAQTRCVISRPLSSFKAGLNKNYFLHNGAGFPWLECESTLVCPFFSPTQRIQREPSVGLLVDSKC